MTAQTKEVIQFAHSAEEVTEGFFGADFGYPFNGPAEVKTWSNFWQRLHRLRQPINHKALHEGKASDADKITCAKVFVDSISPDDFRRSALGDGYFPAVAYFLHRARSFTEEQSSYDGEGGLDPDGARYMVRFEDDRVVRYLLDLASTRDIANIKLRSNKRADDPSPFYFETERPSTDVNSERIAKLQKAQQRLRESFSPTAPAMRK